QIAREFGILIRQRSSGIFAHLIFPPCRHQTAKRCGVSASQRKPTTQAHGRAAGVPLPSRSYLYPENIDLGKGARRTRACRGTDRRESAVGCAEPKFPSPARPNAANTAT